VPQVRRADEYFSTLERKYNMGLRAADHAMRRWALRGA
jgi:hypothetical protein